MPHILHDSFFMVHTWRKQKIVNFICQNKSESIYGYPHNLWAINYTRQWYMTLTRHLRLSGPERRKILVVFPWMNNSIAIYYFWKMPFFLKCHHLTILYDTVFLREGSKSNRTGKKIQKWQKNSKIITNKNRKKVLLIGPPELLFSSFCLFMNTRTEKKGLEIQGVLLFSA